MHLYLIRHGQSHVNLKEWTSGNSDEGLTELGRRQVKALAAWLPANVPGVDVLYSSTMRRARETAGAVSAAYGLPICFDDRIREVGNNRSDHTPWPNEDLPEYGDFWGSERPYASVTPSVDGGESLMHVRTRLGLFIEMLLEHHREETVLAVCHGGVIDIASDYFFNIGVWRNCELITANTGITHVEYRDGSSRERWRLHFHNRTRHLQALEQAAG